MAELLLTAAEKAALLWTDLDDASLGALLRKTLVQFQTATEQRDRAIPVAAALLLCADAFGAGATELTVDLDGVTLEGGDFGDWQVVARRKAAVAPAGPSAPPKADEPSAGWVCASCGVDRCKAPCPKGHQAALTGDCPMRAVAGPALAKVPARAVSEEAVLRDKVQGEGGAQPVPALAEDAISRSKRILALVDAYADRPDHRKRTDLRVALMGEFEAARSQGRDDFGPSDMRILRCALADFAENPRVLDTHRRQAQRMWSVLRQEANQPRRQGDGS